MVFVSYSHRILVDYDFIKWLSTHEGKAIVISKLLRINKNSRDNKGEQIVITPKDYRRLCSEGIIKDKTMILGCLFPKELDEGIKAMLEEKETQLSDDSLRGILGVSLTGEPPFEVALFSTKEGMKKYDNDGLGNFFEKIDNLSIKNEEESLYIIEKLYKDFTNERAICR